MSAQNMHRLGDHAEIARYGRFAGPGMQNIPFNNRNATSPPLVQVGGVTRILVYPGSFNPPHRGHMNLLDHVFENAGWESEFHAAIIMLMDDEHLTRKLRNLPENGLLIPLERRIALWQTAVNNDKYWVWDNGGMDKFQEFVQALRSRLSSHTTIELVALLGPDSLSVTEKAPSPRTWYCQHLITSNAWRGAPYAGDVMQKLAGCTSWQHTSTDRQVIGQKIQKKMEGRIYRLIHEEIERVAWLTQRTVWCRLEDEPDCILRYIPFDPIPGQGNMSSTDIRQAMAPLMGRPQGVNVLQMADILHTAGALSPDMLADCIWDGVIQEIAATGEEGPSA